MRSTVKLRLGQKPRLGVSIRPRGGADPWNLTDAFAGGYFAAKIVQGAVHVQSAFFAGPVFWQESVPVTSDAAGPTLALDYQRRLWLVYERTAGGSAAMLSWSGDQGKTFGAADVAIAGGTKPTIAAGHDGTILIAAIVGGVLWGRVQYPGRVTFEPAYKFRCVIGGVATDFAVEDDRFHFEQEWGPMARWWLHVRLLGDPDTSHWWSGDVSGGVTATWTRGQE